jgi:hypothetical protein
VGKQKRNAYEEINRTYQAVKDDPRVQALGCKDVLIAANKVYQDLRRIETDIDHWKQQEYVEKRADAERTMVEFGEQFQLLLDYSNSLRTVKKEYLAKTEAVDAKGKRRRTKLADELSCPKSLATLASQLLGSDNDDPCLSFATTPYLEFIIDEKSFTCARIFADPRPKQASPHFYALVAAAKTAQTKIAMDKHLAGANALKADSGKTKASVSSASSHAVCVLPDHNIAWNDPDSKTKEFDMFLQRCTPMLSVQRNYIYSGDIENNPLRGFGFMLTVVTGHFFVVALDLEDVIVKGRSIETLPQYMDDIGYRGLRKSPHFGVAAGETLWIPFGFVAVTMGLQSPTNLDEDEVFSSYIANYCLDMAAAKRSNTCVRTEISAYTAKAIAKGLKVLKNNGKVLLDFCAAASVDDLKVTEADEDDKDGAETPNKSADEDASQKVASPPEDLQITLKEALEGKTEISVVNF